jgi:cysteine desulfurase
VIYLDHNATTPLDPRVLEAMLPYLTDSFGNASSYYQLGRDAREAVEEARERVAACIGGRAEEIVFTAGGTEADNLALRGVARSLSQKGRHLVTSCIEHHAVLETCKALVREGFEVSFVPVDAEGRVDPDEVRRQLRPDTILLSVMAANNETGAIQPLTEIGGIARERGVLLHTDAVQALGKMALDVEDMRVDLLSLSAHKFHGPKGVGALYVRRDTPLESCTTGGHQERGLRGGTENVAGIVGLAEAALITTRGLEPEAKSLAVLRDRLEGGIRERVDGVVVNSGGTLRVPNTSNLSFPGVDGESILLHLELRGICASTGSACTTDSPEPSHVLQAMGREPRIAQGSIRFSLGHRNTPEEIDRTVEAIAEIVPKLATISSVS